LKNTDGRKLRLPDTYCESPTWWQEFGIFIITRGRKRFIGIGSPPVKPIKTLECPILEAKSTKGFYQTRS
jgi:hypothetical protein